MSKAPMLRGLEVFKTFMQIPLARVNSPSHVVFGGHTHKKKLRTNAICQSSLSVVLKTSSKSPAKSKTPWRVSKNLHKMQFLGKVINPTFTVEGNFWYLYVKPYPSNMSKLKGFWRMVLMGAQADPTRACMLPEVDEEVDWAATSGPHAGTVPEACKILQGKADLTSEQNPSRSTVDVISQGGDAH